MKFNILIVNFHSAQNAGDAALVKLNIEQLRKSFAEPVFTVCANYPDEEFFRSEPGINVIPSAYALVGANKGDPEALQILRLACGFLLAFIAGLLPASWLRWLLFSRWGPFLQAHRRADLIAAVSGNQFLSMGKYGWPFPLTAASVLLAHLYRKPFYVMPQSIGPFIRGWERFLVEGLYGRARLIFLRDAISIDLAKEIGLPQGKTLFSPDPAFALAPSGRAEASQILSRYGYSPDRLSIGVTVIASLAKTLNQQTIRRYYTETAIALKRFSQTIHARVYIFNQVVGPSLREDDRVAAHELLSQWSNSAEDIVVVDEALSPMQLKACYGMMDLFLASRLHSAIFAISMNVPTLVVGYFTKAHGMLQSMGLEECYLDIADLTSDLLVARLEQLWRNREEIQAKAGQKVSEFDAAIWQTGARIGEDFNCGPK